MITYDVSDDIGLRDYMEDRYIIEIFNNLYIFAIFDGHGGDYVSTFLKLNFIDIFKENYSTSNDMNKIIYETFKSISSKLNKNDSLYCGSTCILVIYDSNNNIIYEANIGDSRSIIIENNKLIHQTDDHKPNFENERIIKNGGNVIIDAYGVPRLNGTLAISRSFGDFYLFPALSWKPDIYTIKLSKNSNDKYVILASDGIWDVIQHNEIINELSKTKNIKYAINNLIKLAKLKGSTDNITLIILKINL